jgi:hypothetical protein
MILLDINGVLCCKVPKNSDKYDFELNSYKVIVRPGCSEFLDFCYNQFTVGFFSSTGYTNAHAILKRILTPDQWKLTKIMWFRDRTHFDPEYVNSHDTIKKLQDIFDNPMVNAKRQYNSENTILVDDSSIKTRFNNPKNIVIVGTFKGDKDDYILFPMMDIITQKFKEL